MNEFKFGRGYVGVKLIPVLEPGVRWVDRPELELNYFNGQRIRTRRYVVENFDLRNSSLRLYMDSNLDAYFAIFQATHFPTGNRISVEDGNTHLLDFRQPDMLYRMVVINDLMRPEPDIYRIF